MDPEISYNVAQKLRGFLKHLGPIYDYNSSTRVSKIIIHPMHLDQVKALGIDPLHPLILWIDLTQPSNLILDNFVLD